MSLAEYGYDGSFEGLLCAFAEAIARGESPSAFTPDTGQATGSLFGSHHIPTDPVRAADLLRGLVSAGGPGAATTLLYAFLAEDPAIHPDMMAYCRLTLERGECIDGWHGNDSVRRVTGTARRAGRELHRFKGLLRFRELADGWLYAPYEPDHDITLPLAKHFRIRLRDQRWVVHDVRRNKAVLWNGRELHPTEVDNASPNDAGAGLPLSDEERAVQRLWRDYHRKISITTRRNPALQRQFMPRKYWKYLVEMAPAGPGDV